VEMSATSMVSTFFGTTLLGHGMRKKKKVKEENEKVGLKLNIQKSKIMASLHGK